MPSHYADDPPNPVRALEEERRRQEVEPDFDSMDIGETWVRRKSVAGVDICLLLVTAMSSE